MEKKTLLSVGLLAASLSAACQGAGHAYDDEELESVSEALTGSAIPGSVWPATGSIVRKTSVNGHHGIDIGASNGSPLYAAQSGTVLTPKNDPSGWGCNIGINHSGGNTWSGDTTLYAHVSATYVSPGQQVARGTLIGRTGGVAGGSCSGNSSGPHLHFEFRKNDLPVDLWDANATNPVALQYINQAAPPLPPPLKPDGFGVYRPSKAQFFLAPPGVGQPPADTYGDVGDKPVIGDWNGDGKDEKAVFRDGMLYIPGFFPINFGIAGDLPVSGDWNNDGFDDFGVYRQSQGAFLIRYPGEPAARVVPFGNGPGDVPIVGDWNGDGTDDLGLYRTVEAMFYLKDPRYTEAQAINFGAGNGDLPVAGDWNADGTDDVGIYRSFDATFHLRNPVTGAADKTVFGARGDVPAVGRF